MTKELAEILRKLASEIESGNVVVTGVSYSYPSDLTEIGSAKSLTRIIEVKYIPIK